MRFKEGKRIVKSTTTRRKEIEMDITKVLNSTIINRIYFMVNGRQLYRFVVEDY